MTKSEPNLPSSRRAIMVLGPHRSGTSVVTRALLSAGVDLGSELLPANADNPKGFFENAHVVAFNDRLLKHLGLCLDYPGLLDIGPLDDTALQPWREEAANLLNDEFGSQRLIALKDPRLCMLSPFWDATLRSCGFAVDSVLVLRHPVECARSQAARFAANPAFHFVGATLEEGAALWASYLVSALTYLQNRHFVMTLYEEFVNVPQQATRQLLQALQLPVRDEEIEAFATGFLDSSLHRQVQQNSDQEAIAALVDSYTGLIGADEGAASDWLGPLRHAGSALLDVHSSLNLYVRARHAAVEAGLALRSTSQELRRAQQELEQLKQQRDLRLRQLTDSFVAERRKTELLQLQLATRNDLLEDIEDKEAKLSDSAHTKRRPSQ